MTKSKSRLVVILLVYAILSNGCKDENSVLHSVAPPTSTVALEPVSSRTPPKTPTQLAPTQTVEPSPTPTLRPATPTPAQSAILPCAGDGVPAKPSSEFGFNGGIAYWNRNAQRYYLVGGQPLTEIELPIPTDPTSMIGFSPDGKWLAYTSGPIFEKSTHFHLLSFRGEKIAFPIKDNDLLDYSSPYSVGGWTWSGWLNDELIYVHLGNPIEGNLLRSVFSLFDPFTGEWQPDILASLPRRTMDGGVLLSPDLSRVLYASGDPDQIHAPALTFYDLPNQKIIWQEENFEGVRFNINYGGTTNSTAAWSPDGTLLAYTGPETNDEDMLPISEYGIFLSDPDGIQHRRITNFFGQYEGFTSESLTWSPNSKYLAFVLGHRDPVAEYVYKLFVYDTTVDQAVEVCPIYGEVFFSNLVWSPDSRYIAYTAEQEERPYPLVAIDLSTGSFFEVTDDATILGGWSDKFQP